MMAASSCRDPENRKLGFQSDALTQIAGRKIGSDTSAARPEKRAGAQCSGPFLFSFRSRLSGRSDHRGDQRRDAADGDPAVDALGVLGVELEITLAIALRR